MDWVEFSARVRHMRERQRNEASAQRATAFRQQMHGATRNQ